MSKLSKLNVFIFLSIVLLKSVSGRTFCEVDKWKKKYFANKSEIFFVKPNFKGFKDNYGLYDCSLTDSKMKCKLNIPWDFDPDCEIDVSLVTQGDENFYNNQCYCKNAMPRLLLIQTPPARIENVIYGSVPNGQYYYFSYTYSTCNLEIKYIISELRTSGSSFWGGFYAVLIGAEVAALSTVTGGLASGLLAAASPLITYGIQEISDRDSKTDYGNYINVDVNKKYSVKISSNGLCGSNYGSCPSGKCCSKYGYCGTSSSHCGSGCQSAFGKCSSNNTKISSNGRCGSNYGSCPSGKCCSKYGYCGTSSSHCDSGCQTKYGKCKSQSNSGSGSSSSSKVSSNKSKTSSNGKCGNINGVIYICPNNQCCSKNGYCGLSSSYCGSGCQSKYGKCGKISSKKGYCGSNYGICSEKGQCCSKYGYCGTSSAYCGSGCQSKYGKCNSSTGNELIEVNYTLEKFNFDMEDEEYDLVINELFNDNDKMTKEEIEFDKSYNDKYDYKEIYNFDNEDLDLFTELPNEEKETFIADSIIDSNSNEYPILNARSIFDKIHLKEIESDLIEDTHQDIETDLIEDIHYELDFSSQNNLSKLRNSNQPNNDISGNNFEDKKSYLISFKHKKVSYKNDTKIISDDHYIQEQIKKLENLLISDRNKNKRDIKNNIGNNDNINSTSHYHDHYDVNDDDSNSKDVHNNYDNNVIESIEKIDITSTNEDLYVLSASLTEENIELIKENINDIYEIEEDINVLSPLRNDNQNSKFEKLSSLNIINEVVSDYFNVTDILKSTNWKGIKVQPNAPNHLSLLSQYNYDSDIIHQYDNYYYYPASAGSGVDIFLIDSGLIVNHKDFDTTYRTITCDAIVKKGILTEVVDDPIQSRYCIGDREELYHGIAVTSVAGGVKLGVARKANLHMIAVDKTIKSRIAALNYIRSKAKENKINPHKCVISMSHGYYQYEVHFDELLQEMIDEGFMFIASAGNDQTNSCTMKARKRKIFDGMGEIIDEEDIHDMHYPSSYNRVIGVGAIYNNIRDSSIKSEMVDSDQLLSIYSKAFFSNYGDCITLFAPGYALVAQYEENDMNNKNILNKAPFEYVDYKYGTSFSAPIVAGISALLISQNSDIQFNQSILREMLIELSQKDSINNLQDLIFDNPEDESVVSPNRIVNNGKKIVYSKNFDYREKTCGIRAGNRKCPEGYCCSKEGYCNVYSKFCSIEKGCQSEFGECYTHKYISEDNIKVWLFNTKSKESYGSEDPLCLEYVGEGEVPVLNVCKNNDQQKWFILPEEKSSLIINVYEPLMCLTLENGKVITNRCNENSTKFSNLKDSLNKNTIQEFGNSNKCLDILKEEDSDLYKLYAKVEMKNCITNEYSTSQQWQLLSDVPGMNRYIINKEEFSNIIKSNDTLSQYFSIENPYKNNLNTFSLFEYIINLNLTCSEYGGNLILDTERYESNSTKNNKRNEESEELFMNYYNHDFINAYGENNNINLSCNNISEEYCSHLANENINTIYYDLIVENKDITKLIFNYIESTNSTQRKCIPRFINTLDSKISPSTIHDIVEPEDSKYISLDYTLNWITTTVNNIQYCISAEGGINSNAKLVECNTQDVTQQWYIPSYTGYWFGLWVNAYDASLCLDIDNDTNQIKIKSCEESTENINITASESITTDKDWNKCLGASNNNVLTGQLALNACAHVLEDQHWKFQKINLEEDIEKPITTTTTTKTTTKTTTTSTTTKSTKTSTTTTKSKTTSTTTTKSTKTKTTTTKSTTTTTTTTKSTTTTTTTTTTDSTSTPSSFISKYYNSVWIYNYNLDLCLTYSQVSNRPRLQKCSATNKNQKWLLPKYGVGYYVNEGDNSICFSASSSGNLITDKCDPYGIIMNNIEDSHGGEAIWSSTISKYKCLGIYSADSEKTTNIRLSMNTCNTSEKDQHWKAVTVFPNENDE